MPPPLDWLIQGPPWVEYRARLDFLGQPEHHPLVQAARAAMLDHPLVRGLLAELAGWPGPVLNSHKSAGHPIHKLAFLADLGLRAGDPGMDLILPRVLEHQDPAGPFQVLMNISPSYGGSGEDTWAWALCDAPLLVYALARFGLGADPRVQAAAAHLAALVRENGWPCAVSLELGKFRGPGRKSDPCPYANLAMLKALAELPVWREGPAARAGAETLLSLWESRRESHPYMFFMGTDFSKLKAPLVWYDLLHVAGVLSRFPWVHGDPRFQSMLDAIRAKAGPDARFTPESVWTAWKDWDFGQKKVPSPWLTLLAWTFINPGR